MGTGGSFPEGKAPGREADHLSPSSTEFKNAWSYTSTLSYVFIVRCWQCSCAIPSNLEEHVKILNWNITKWWIRSLHRDKDRPSLVGRAAAVINQPLSYPPTYLPTYLTLWSGVLKKMRVTKIVSKFPAFYGTRRFITVLTSPIMRLTELASSRYSPFKWVYIKCTEHA